MSEPPVKAQRTVIIEADPETVFEFLIHPALMAEWFGIGHVLEPRVGGKFEVEVSSGTSRRACSPKSCRVGASLSLGVGNPGMPP